jgi:hypothetical protein
MYSDRDAEASFRADQQAPPGVPSSESSVKSGDRVGLGGGELSISADPAANDHLNRKNPSSDAKGERTVALRAIRIA